MRGVEGRKLRGLRALRLDRALSQRDLAAASGVAQATINRLELGHRAAYPSTVRKLASALGVDPPALYGPDAAVGGGGPIAPAG
jgi:transcriptional regulator with XRE-family HTH domain